MSKPPITLEGINAMEAARLEWHAAIDALRKAFSQGTAYAEFRQALRRLNEKQAACTALSEKFFKRYPRN